MYIYTDMHISSSYISLYVHNIHPYPHGIKAIRYGFPSRSAFLVCIPKIPSMTMMKSLVFTVADLITGFATSERTGVPPELTQKDNHPERSLLSKNKWKMRSGIKKPAAALDFQT